MQCFEHFRPHHQTACFYWSAPCPQKFPKLLTSPANENLFQLHRLISLASEKLFQPHRLTSLASENLFQLHRPISLASEKLFQPHRLISLASENLFQLHRLISLASEKLFQFTPLAHPRSEGSALRGARWRRASPGALPLGSLHTTQFSDHPHPAHHPSSLPTRTPPNISTQHLYPPRPKRGRGSHRPHPSADAEG